MIAMAALFLTLLGKSLRSAFRRRRNSSALQDYRAEIVVAIVSAYLLGMTLWAIWRHG